MTRKQARIHLAIDPVMKALIAEHGPCPLKPRLEVSPYQALVRSIMFQQISGAAASAIMGRFLDLFEDDFPRPADLAAMEVDDLRAAGLSRNKALAVIDVAAKTLEGIVPGHQSLAALDDEAVIERLVQVRGVGRWTAQMFLIATLGRPDVLPLNDVGLLKGAQIACALKQRPDADAFAALAEKWRPWRSAACWYLWRAADTKMSAGFAVVSRHTRQACPYPE